MKGNDVLILHGWNLSGKRFVPLVRLLEKKGYRVFAPDFPGFGSAGPPPTAWHVADYAGFLHAYIRSKKISRPILIGHSFGGRVALKFEELYPGTARALILTGTPGFSPVPAGKMKFFLLLAKAGGVAFAMPVLTLFADAARKLLYRLAGATEFYRAEGTMRQTFKYIVQDDLSDAMKSVRAPCLLVWGQHDSIVPPAVAGRMKDVIPGAMLTIIPDATHGVPFEDPAAFTDVITGALAT